jgi:hypothetical protein
MEIAELRDAASIVKAEQEIAQEPGFFCSQPSELSEQNVKKTIESSNGIYFVADTQAITLYKKMDFLEEGCLKRRVKTGNGYIWVDIRVLKKDAVSPFVWAIIQGENACTK